MTEITVQPGKMRLQSLIGLTDLLTACESDTSAANLMAEDLLDFFETANHQPLADRKLSVMYFPEHEIRAHILQEHTSRALTRLKDLYEQTHSLIDTLRREEERLSAKADSLA